jgi:ubiquinone biosynthesis protein
VITIRNLRHLVHQLRRASQIATILWASGFSWLLAAVGLRSCVNLGCRTLCAIRLRQCHHHVDMGVPLPVRMRYVLEALGPTFVKVGQMLAMRPDYVPLAYAEALRPLQDHVEPFGAEAARTVIEAELGHPLGELFATFEADPFAAASLSQVHRATLPDGRRVAVKVQRPGVAETMREDLDLLAILARRLERRAPQALGFRPTAMIAELSDTTARELDFRQEARTCTRVGQDFADRDDIVIPWIDPDRTTARVLTMQLIDGVSPAPGDSLRRLGFDVERLLHTGAEAMLNQLFTFGLFHADPHPGNLLFLPGDRVAFLDFGIFGRLRPRDRRQLAIMMWALLQGDYDAVAGQLLRFATLGADADPQAFRDALQDVVADWDTGADPPIAHLLLRELGLGARFGILFPRDLMLVARALIGLDATASLVSPERSFRQLLEPLIDEVRAAVLPSSAQLKTLMEQRRFDYLQLALDLPDLLPDVMHRLQSSSATKPVPRPPARTIGRSPAWLILAAAAGAAAGGLTGSRAVHRRRAGK